MRHGVVGSSPRRLAAPALLLLLLLPHGLSSECSPPTEPENGGYRCRPSPCQGLPHNTVIEYFCDEGYALKGDEKFLTCQNGEWDHSLQISCRPVQGQFAARPLTPNPSGIHVPVSHPPSDKDPGSSLGVPALTVVASTASCVALILLLVVLFVLVRPRLKSFHHSRYPPPPWFRAGSGFSFILHVCLRRREQEVSGQPCSVMVGGVQVPLPSYEEAVHGCSSTSAEMPLPTGVSEEVPHRDRDDHLLSCRSQTDTVLLHQDSSSSALPETPTWGACAGPVPPHRGSGDDDQQSLLSATSAEEFCDDVPLLKDA
uniref:Sushi domain containing 6 n=1 Tax=Oryzias latipes TaxID=8090 RepID=A0A3P9H034_ORYLA